ncbi:CHASE2 domain-containing sensor protein [Rubricella aquisinus]|uniref:CHASE2 domain-containing sensor protein n=1 Tax=Rubricella aquisinus TaxID=2028108 RepID=A0A840WP48_9RHOB|nr:hypothetical protein [Rubricella aquisinus]MBB5516829.1 CHASE2 domain-containing sensor protein [Rubricella aquisinus]
MNTPFLFLAAALGTVTAAAHIFVGGPKNAAPVLTAPGLPNGPRVTVSFAWHAASLFLIFVAAAYLLAALGVMDSQVVVLTTVHCGLLMVLSTAMALRGGISPLAFPPAVLFALITVSGAAALWL